MSQITSVQHSDKTQWNKFPIFFVKWFSGWFMSNITKLVKIC